MGDGPRVPGRHERHSFVRVGHFPLVIVKKRRGLEGDKMKKGGIVVERMEAGALRADGQRMMIGDDEENKTAEGSSGATRELAHSRG